MTRNMETLMPSPIVMRSPLRQPKSTGDVGDMVMLAKILSYMRPHGSDAEEQFMHDYIDCLDAEVDDFGNRFIRIGNAPILFSAHVDTVHRNGGYQRLMVHPDGNSGSDFRVKPGDGNCLGADDGTGVWLLIQLLKAGIPGLYVFHRGEECGCLGSAHISKKEHGLLKDIHYAVAFDRRGYNSVITHQRGQRCCSEVFATALADKLGGLFKPDSTGMYTDTGEYTKQIPECTNLSVGYFNQHCSNESQNITFVRKLKDRLLSVNWLDLPHPRDPTLIERNTYSNTSYSGGYNGNTYKTPKLVSEMSYYELVEKYPFNAMALLRKAGITEADLRREIEPWKGHPPAAATPVTDYAPGYGPNDPDDYGQGWPGA